MDGPTDLDALAEALRVDGVVVDRVMGSGEAEEAEDRIAKLIRQVPFPVYVALIEQPDGLPSGDRIAATDALAGLLNRRLGDGLYVLASTEGLQQTYSFGLGADPTRLSLSASSNIEAMTTAMERVGDFSYGTEDYITTPATVEAEAIVLTAKPLLELGRGPFLDGANYPATLADADADRLATYAIQVRAASDWRPSRDEYVSVRNASSGLSALVGGLSALVIALLVGQTLRGWPRRRAALSAAEVAAAAHLLAVAPPDLETERACARDLVDELAEKLASTDWGKVRDRDVAGRALTARDAVEPLLESDDVADLIGAQVVARAGSRDLVRGRSGSGGPRVTCFFDPRHPESTTVATWRLGDGDVAVPCCAACGTAVVHDGAPAFLRLRTGRGSQPYWERDDVWARTGFGAITDDLASDVLAERAGER